MQLGEAEAVLYDEALPHLNPRFPAPAFADPGEGTCMWVIDLGLLPSTNALHWPMVTGDRSRVTSLHDMSNPLRIS